MVSFQHSQFLINVQDQLHDTSMATATSVHWHGLFQKNTTWADGVAFVSQCPLTPGKCTFPALLHSILTLAQATHSPTPSTQRVRQAPTGTIIVDPLSVKRDR
jgi:FtsP/CotA-like multicopper oxidase with cupredoxin domain